MTVTIIQTCVFGSDTHVYCGVHVDCPSVCHEVQTSFCNLLLLSVYLSLLCTAICHPECQNGGHCISPGHCECAGTGFLGSRCDERRLIQL